MQIAMRMMNDEFIECMKMAEEKNGMSFVIKGKGGNVRGKRCKRSVLF